MQQPHEQRCQRKEGALTIYKERSESTLTGSDGKAHFPQQMEI